MIISRNFSLNINDFSVIDIHFYKTAESLWNSALQLVVYKIVLIEISVTKHIMNVIETGDLVAHLLIHSNRGVHIAFLGKLVTSLSLLDLLLPIDYFLFILP